MNSKKLSLNMIGQLASFVCSLGISFILTPYIIATLGQETYGFVGLATNVTSYITLFTVAISGMLSRYVTIEYCKKDYEAASGYFTTALIAQAVLAGVLLIPMLLLAGNMNRFFNVPSHIVSDVKWLWVLMFLSFLSGLPVSGYSAATFATNRLEIQAAINIASNFLRSATLIIAFVFFTPHVWYIGFAAIASSTLVIVLNMISKKKLMPQVKVDKKYYHKKYIHNLLMVGIWNSLNRLQQILYTGLDLLITNIFINASEMGILSIAKTIPTQISALISTVSGTFDPTMTIAYGKGDKEDFLRQTKFAMKFCGFLCSVPILGFVAFGENFYRLWMPSLSDANVWKVQILAMLTLFPQVFSVYIFPLYTVNTITTKLKVPVFVSIAIGIVNVILVCVLLQVTDLGVYAVAGVSSVLWLLRIFLFVPSYAAWTIKMKWTVFYGTLLRGVVNVFLISGVFFVIAHFLEAASWARFLTICCGSAVLGYLLCFFVMFEKTERQNVINIIKKRFVRKGN